MFDALDNDDCRALMYKSIIHYHCHTTRPWYHFLFFYVLTSLLLSLSKIKRDIFQLIENYDYFLYLSYLFYLCNNSMFMHLCILRLKINLRSNNIFVCYCNYGYSVLKCINILKGNFHVGSYLFLH